MTTVFSQDGAVRLARVAHNHEVVGSNPTPATSSGDRLGIHQPRSIEPHAIRGQGRVRDRIKGLAVTRFSSHASDALGLRPRRSVHQRRVRTADLVLKMAERTCAHSDARESITNECASARRVVDGVNSPANACPAIASPACRQRRMSPAEGLKQAASRLAARRSAAGAFWPPGTPPELRAA